MQAIVVDVILEAEAQRQLSIAACTALQIGGRARASKS